MIKNSGKGIVPEDIVRKSPVQSISRATGILRCLLNNTNTIKEIAVHTRLSMATVHRILKALEEEDFVFQDPVERKYYLGPFASQLALSQSNTHRWLIARSLTEMNRIWGLFNEFTALDIEVGLQTINLLTIQSKSNYSITRPPRSFLGSESIVFLAQHENDELEVILDHMNPKSPDGDLLIDKEQVKKQVNQARRQGYFIRAGSIEGIMAISVPISHYMCPLALSLVGPEIRLKPLGSRVVAEMQKSASLISENIYQRLPKPVN